MTDIASQAPVTFKAIDGGVIQWRGNNTGGCQLTGGHTYYLNFITADVSGVTPTGGSATSTKNLHSCPGGAACSVNIVDVAGTWSGYIPQ